MNKEDFLPYKESLLEAFRVSMFRRDHNFTKEDIDFIRSLPPSKKDMAEVGILDYDDDYFCDFLALQLSRFRKKTKKMSVEDFLESLDLERLYSAMRGFLFARSRAAQYGIDPNVTNYIIPFDKTEESDPKNSSKNFYNLEQFDRTKFSSTEDDKQSGKEKSLIFRSDIDSIERKKLSGQVQISSERQSSSNSYTVNLSKVNIKYLYGDPFKGGWWAAVPLSKEAGILLGKDRFCISYFNEDHNLWNKYDRDNQITVFLVYRPESIVSTDKSSFVKYIVFTKMTSDALTEIKNENNTNLSNAEVSYFLDNAPAELFDAVNEHVYPIEFLLRMSVYTQTGLNENIREFANQKFYEKVVQEILRGKQKPLYTVVPKSIVVEMIKKYGKEVTIKPFLRYLNDDDMSLVSKGATYISVLDLLESKDEKEPISKNDYELFSKMLREESISPDMFGGKIVEFIFTRLLADSLWNLKGLEDFKSFLEEFSPSSVQNSRYIITNIFCSRPDFYKAFQSLYNMNLLDFSPTKPSSIGPELIAEILYCCYTYFWGDEFRKNVFGTYVSNVYKIVPVASRFFRLVTVALQLRVPFDSKILIWKPFVMYLKNKVSYLYRKVFLNLVEKVGGLEDVLQIYESHGLIVPESPYGVRRFVELLRSGMDGKDISAELDNFEVPQELLKKYAKISLNYLLDDEFPESAKFSLARWIFKYRLNDQIFDLFPRSSFQRKEIENLLNKYSRKSFS